VCRALTGGVAARNRAREAPAAPRGFSSFAVAYGHAMDSRCAAAPLRKNDSFPRDGFSLRGDAAPQE
jgi:hypothetical protein